MNRVKHIGCAALLAVLSSMALWAMQAGETQDFDSLVTAAKEAQTRSDFAQAAAYCRQAAKMRPEVAELWANLGLMDSLAGNSSNAIKDFTEAAHLNGSMFVPQLFLGIEYLDQEHACLGHSQGIHLIHRAVVRNEFD